MSAPYLMNEPAVQLELVRYICAVDPSCGVDSVQRFFAMAQVRSVALDVEFKDEIVFIDEDGMLEEGLGCSKAVVDVDRHRMQIEAHFSRVRSARWVELGLLTWADAYQIVKREYIERHQIRLLELKKRALKKALASGLPDGYAYLQESFHAHPR